MEELIKEIKALTLKNGSIGQTAIDNLTTKFRERSVSVMALEEILNFYMSERNCCTEVHKDAFVPINDATRTSNDILVQQKEDAEHRYNAISYELEDMKRKIQNLRKKNKILNMCVLFLSIVIMVFFIYVSKK